MISLLGICKSFVLPCVINHLQETSGAAISVDAAAFELYGEVRKYKKKNRGGEGRGNIQGGGT